MICMSYVNINYFIFTIIFLFPAGCRSHSNCPFDKACVNRMCQDPCTIGGVCGVNTQCHVEDHKAVCSCIPTYTGSPLHQCSRSKYL